MAEMRAEPIPATTATLDPPGVSAGGGHDAPQATPELSRAVARSTLLQVLLMLGGAACALGTLRVAARHLGTDGFGSVAAALALTAVLASGADLGCGVVAAREAARHPQQAAGVVVSLAVLRAAAGLALAPVAAATALVLYGGSSAAFSATLVLAPSLVLLSVQSALGALFVARGRNTVNVGVSAQGAAGLLAGALVVAATGGGTTTYAVAVLASEALATAAAAGLFLHAGGASARPLPARAIRRLVVVALPLGVIQVANMLYLRVDAVILAALRPASDVAVYVAAYQVIQLVMTLPALFMTALLPAVATANPRRVRALLQRALEVSTTAGVPLVLLLASTAPVLLDTVAAPGFDAGMRALQLLALAAGVSFATAVYGNALIARGHQRAMLAMTGAVVLANIVSNLVLVPRFGPAGAAAAMAATEALSLVLVSRLALRLLGFRLRLVRLAPAVAAGAAATVAWLLLDHLHPAVDLRAAALSAVVIGCVDVGVLAALGGLRPFAALLPQRRG